MPLASPGPQHGGGEGCQRGTASPWERLCSSSSSSSDGRGLNRKAWSPAPWHRQQLTFHSCFLWLLGLSASLEIGLGRPHGLTSTHWGLCGCS